MNKIKSNTLIRKSLYIDEAKDSLNGFRISLGLENEGVIRASLHAKDLSSVFMCIGAVGPSEVLTEISIQLALRNLKVIEIAKNFTQKLDQLLCKIFNEEDHSVASDAEDWNSWFVKINSIALSFDTNNYLGYLKSVQAVDLSGNYVPSKNDSVKVGSVLIALNLLQEARSLNFKDDDRTVLQIDAVLSELQDWMLRLDQCSFSDIWSPITIQGGDIGVDQAQANLLIPLKTIVSRARRCYITYRSLTVFIDLETSALSSVDIELLDQVVPRLCGRIHKTEAGFRIIMPTSFLRQRVTPFIHKGSSWVIANSLIVNYLPDSLGASFGRLEIMIGSTYSSVNVERILPSENMNIHPLIDESTAPHGVTLIAKNGRDDSYFVWPAKAIL